MKFCFLAVSLAMSALCAPAFALAAQVNVNISDNVFSPRTLNINAGDTVVWTNNGTMAHTVTADNVSFVSSTLQPRQTYSFTFSSAGVFPYYCSFHGGPGGVGMSGVINVAAPQTAPPPPVAVATTSAPATSPQNTAAPITATALLQAQINILQQTLAQLQKSKAVSSNTTNATNTGAVSSCSAIVPTLKSGSSGTGVSQLQQFLALDSSIYPEGLVTGYFGALTQAAVQRFQAKNTIVSSGTPASTGYGLVGPHTAAVIQTQCVASGSATNTIPSGEPAGPVGGFIQVSPISGPPPLQVEVQATVNTTSSCVPALYTIDYGDSSQQDQIPFSGGSCQPQQQTFTHTYTQIGAYQITLAAGSHKSSATVVVQTPQ